MLGLFGTLNLATRSLQAQQAGVAVTGQNLANANNPAYSRQAVDLQTSISLPTPVGQEGTGVEVGAIRQTRDSLLDGQVCDETSVGGYWQAQQSALENTQTELGEFLNGSVTGATGSGDATNPQGLSAQLSDLFSAFQSVATDPGSMPQRQALVNQAQMLTATFNQISTQLSSVSDSLNSSITNDTASANQLLSQIADLNQEITSAEAGSSGTANDLRDTREQKLEALAQLVNFQSSTASDGTLSLSVGGYQMVSGGQVVSTLGTEQSQGKLMVYSTKDNATLTLTGGSIQGAMATRDGALADLSNGLNTLASQLITQVNSIYQNGYDLNGGTGADFLTGNDASDIGVNSALVNDPSQVQAAGVAGASGDNTVALALAQLAQQPNAGLGNQTFSDAYGQLVTNLGNSLSNANDQVANHSAVSTLLQNQRDSVSGVSLEEEMTSLLTFQRAYQASAQVMSTVNQMLETLIGIKTS